MDSTSSTSLCTKCIHYIHECHQTKPFEKRFEHHDNFESLKTSVRNGCRLCTKIWDYLTKLLIRHSVTLEQMFHSNNMSRGSMKDIKPGMLILMLVVQWTKDSLHSTLGTRFDPPILCFTPLVMTSAGNTCLGKVTNTSDIMSDKSVGTSWNQITSWLATCRSSHEQCCFQNHSERRFAPTRLLRISDDGSVVQVVDTQTVPGHGFQYITLSYCWGLEKALKHETSTRAKLYQGVDVQMLPRTYQDTMLIAHRLQVRYVWIDALCIRQDVREDWLAESAVMHKIYGEALLTISATSGTSVNSGLFESGSNVTSKSPLFSFEFGDGPEPFILEWLNPAVSLLSDSPVSRRAWILQERLLSRRILHFADEQMFWECNELGANERFPDGLPDYITSQLRTESTSVFTAQPASNQHIIVSQSPALVWNNIIATYTSRLLTNQSDKLPALSGLASRFQDIFLPLTSRSSDTRYLAGLWRSHLPHALLWENDNTSTTLTYPQKYQAPSWSPMSLVGKISMSTPNPDVVDCLVKVLDADTTKINIGPNGSTDDNRNEMGQVSDGYIVLSCHTLIKLDQDPSALIPCSEIEEDDVYDFLMPFPLLFNGRTMPTSYMFSLDTPTSWPVDNEPSYLLPITQSKFKNLDVEDFAFGYEVQGLVLKQVMGSRGVYTRIGLLKAYHEVADFILEEIDVEEGHSNSLELYLSDDIKGVPGADVDADAGAIGKGRKVRLI